MPPDVIVHDLFEHISSNPRVFFKNQQINDPELSMVEKENILREVLDKSHCTFLSRFGPFMKDEHLRYFEQNEQTLAYSPDERYEIDYHLERIRKLRNGGRATEVRNRRYAALQKMCNDGTYFSEQEMMQREPLLYEQLVGQYMTEKEKRERDASVPVTPSVVNIIFNQMDKDEAKETLQKLETEEYQEEQQLEDMEETMVRSRPSSPGFPRAQWGNFDDEEETRLEARRHDRQKRARRRQLAIPPAHLITAGERNLLRDEFIGVMYARFIAGEDEEFDYSRVDDSLEYDDLDIVEQDEQEKYFDEDDETEPKASAIYCADEESEDDLDVYMKHLNHHLQQQERFARESNEVEACEYDSDV
ncbi:coiled-coil domain-containing protein 97 [Anopheles ziemanni]|nr:coiled-coil domain-containing protein 97 [Anopheles ziemanni]